ncbi:hypothetical protein SeMB42_g03047 [Synchytrium endobioticum]|nr:hypothetical protein SeMB42_g03047 [Synchytrium endobioticum]
MSSALAICHEKYGDPAKVLQIKSIPLPQFTPSSIKIKFLASPINPSDINQIQGVYPVKPPFHPSHGAIAGSEGLAEVVQVGSAVSSKFAVGDWVIPAAAAWGTWRDYAVAAAHELTKLRIKAHDGVSIASAATMSVNPCTAYRLLKDFVDLEPGDVLVQNGANSAVGQAVVQLSAAWGLTSLNIVRARPDMGELVGRLGGLGASRVWTEDGVDVREARALGRVRLALDCVGGASAANMARVLGDDGHMVTYGGMSRVPVSIPASGFIFRNLTCHGFWMTRWIRMHSEQERLDMMDDLFDLVRKGQLREPWSTYHNVRDAGEKAQEEFIKVIGGAMGGFNASGKTILRIHSE